MSPKWVRPTDVPVPQVWARLQGKPMPDGHVPNFWIQDVREEDDEAIMSIMMNDFLRNEPKLKCLKLADDPEASAEIEAVWRQLLKLRVSLALWTDYPNGPRIVGCNILGVTHKDDVKIEPKTDVYKKIVDSNWYISNQGRIFERYGVERYLSGLGFSIIEEFRGMGLGVEMLKARIPLCQALGFQVTGTFFSSVGAQKQSARSGFELLYEIPYAEYIRNGEVVFDIKEPPTFQIKALKIPPKK